MYYHVCMDIMCMGMRSYTYVWLIQSFSCYFTRRKMYSLYPTIFILVYDTERYFYVIVSSTFCTYFVCRISLMFSFWTGELESKAGNQAGFCSKLYCWPDVWHYEVTSHFSVPVNSSVKQRKHFFYISLKRALKPVCKAEGHN